MDGEVKLSGQAGEQVRARESLPRPRRAVRGDEESSLITPFTVVPKLLAGSKPAQVSWNLLLFVALPAGLFAYWIYVNLTSGVPPGFEGVRLALPLAAVWVVVSPVLMYWGEHLGASWVGAVAGDAAFGWNVERVRVWKQRVDRLYYPTATLGAVGAVVALALALASPVVRDLISVPAGWYWTALTFLVFAYLGFVAMGGLNGVIRWIVVVAAAVTSTELKWHPLRPTGRLVVARCYRISLMLGISFSLGAFFVPVLLLVMDEVSRGAQAVLWGFISLLLVGGILIFTIPVAAMVTSLARSKRRFLDTVEAPIADLLDEMIRHGSANDTTREVLDRAMTVRRLVLATRVVPIGQAIRQGLLTTVVPLASLAVSAQQAGMLV